jgi:uncharacterized membrane protein YeaQ/YmgE (transglycosylase-associated protein family)
VKQRRGREIVPQRPPGSGASALLRADLSPDDEASGRHVWTPTERRQTMEFAIGLGLGGWIVLIVGALLFGAIAQFVGETRTGFEWLGDAIAAGVGALAASEFVVAWRTFEPTWDGLALVPALLGGIVVGLVVEVATRYLTGGTYTGRPVSA